MGVRQTRVFVPSNEPDHGWAETLIGKVFRPLTARFSDQLEWFWFSRYGPLTDDTGDCDITRIPEEYKQPIHPGAAISHRSMRFRFSIADDRQEAMEQWALQTIMEQGYYVSDFRPYDFVSDTGSNRFLGTENRQPGRAIQRARLVTQFYAASSRLVIDALVGPDEDGRYRLETNDDFQNPGGSTFQSIHHLYCNITGTPTEVYVFQKAGLDIIGFGTFINPPTAPPGGWDGSTAYSIWF
ncbi:MAG: hypothetical protein WC073_07215 [Sterolibacterium sp.]